MQKEPIVLPSVTLKIWKAPFPGDIPGRVLISCSDRCVLMGIFNTLLAKFFLLRPALSSYSHRQLPSRPLTSVPVALTPNMIKCFKRLVRHHIGPLAVFLPAQLLRWRRHPLCSPPVPWPPHSGHCNEARREPSEERHPRCLKSSLESQCGRSYTWFCTFSSRESSRISYARTRTCISLAKWGHFRWSSELSGWVQRLRAGACT